MLSYLLEPLSFDFASSFGGTSSYLGGRGALVTLIRAAVVVAPLKEEPSLLFLFLSAKALIEEALKSFTIKGKERPKSIQVKDKHKVQ